MDSHDDDFRGNRARAGYWKGIWLRNQMSVLNFLGVSTVVVFVYHFFSDKDFSFLLTVGSLLVLFSFLLLVAKVALTRKVRNISLKTLQCYALVFAARLSSILRYEGYLPYDKTGDWFYQATECGALALVLGLIAAVAVFKQSYQRDADKLTLPGVPGELGALVLVVPALVLAILLHPTLNGNWVTDTAWAFALYLEAVAMTPQIYMFQSSRNAEVEPLEANFVFSLAVARAMHLVFWMSSFHELNDKDASSSLQRRFPGHLVVISQVLNLLLMADFVYFYVIAARKKTGFVLPTNI
jgi:hypothetical protein